MEKKELETKLNEAIKLLEKAHREIHNAASFSNGKLELIPHLHLRNEVAAFVKSVDKNSELKLYPIEPMQILAC